MIFAGMLLAAISASLVLHSIIRRIRPALNSVIAFLALGIPVGGLLDVSLAANYGWLSFHTFAGVAAYAFCCELYVFLFTMTISSVSVSILLSVAAGAVSKGNGYRASTETMLAQRINTLTRIDLVEHEGNSYGLTPRGRWVANATKILRRAFAHGSHIC